MTAPRGGGGQRGVGVPMRGIVPQGRKIIPRALLGPHASREQLVGDYVLNLLFIPIVFVAVRGGKQVGFDEYL